MPAVNVDKAVIEYRKLIERHESAPKKEKPKLEAEKKKMRQRWKEWEGDDSLHEVAFGEYVENKR